MNYPRLTSLLIIIATIVRCIIAASIELGNDEVYYRLYASVLQWNYFDHPPMVGWLIRLSTINLLVDTGFTIRLGAILACAGATWILYKCGELLQGPYAGFLAAAIYTASIYGSIIAGTFILPDSPQMFFWILCIYLLIKITANKTINRKTIKYILWFGVVSGLGMLCKIHTIFLWFGFGLYVILYQKKWLRHWALYVSVLITILFFSPVIYWNIQNDFITFLYHGKRVDVASGGINIEGLLTFIGGQIFYCNPVVFLLIIWAMLRRSYAIKLAHKRLLFLLGLPLIVIATAVSLFKDLLPHWTGPAFASLILLAACYFAQAEGANTKKRWMPLPISMANFLLLIIVLAGIIVINFLPSTLGSKKPQNKGEDDFTLDMVGWKKCAASFDSIYRSTHPVLNAKEHTILLSDKWFPAAHIDYYLGRPLQIQTFVTGPIEDIHQYHWLNKQRGIPADSIDMYIISPSNYLFDIKGNKIINNIPVSKTDTIIQKRSGAEVRKFYVYYFSKNKFNFDKDFH